jgi:hypothetical protein
VTLFSIDLRRCKQSGKQERNYSRHLRVVSSLKSRNPSDSLLFSLSPMIATIHSKQRSIQVFRAGLQPIANSHQELSTPNGE